MNKKLLWLIFGFLAAGILFTAATLKPQELNPTAPDKPVKLIFIHHSTGENWLADSYGNLGQVLSDNNYFVSDTNYGWGPNYIGDRTDIPDWIEWFRSDQTGTYMDAVFNESNQHASYSRALPDPGGENQIVMFKSCFPNSELSGHPNDPAGTYGDLSVAGAKYVYNELLKYFATRPDKLFVVITAPPLSSRTNAKNARAFNLWLVNDWLGENNYTQNNVAVFDFYTILTADNAHHRYKDGAIVHQTGNRDTLHYPTGDDHPSSKGSRKATEEFVPLLNIFYHQWAAGAPLEPPESSSVSEPPSEEASDSPDQPHAPSAGSAISIMLSDFESDSVPGTNGWEVFWDESSATAIQCTSQANSVGSGMRSLEIGFDIAPNAWGTCALFYDSPQDWSQSNGVTFLLHTAETGLIFDVHIYSGNSDTLESYVYTIESPSDSTADWIPVSLGWTDFHRVEWEENAGAPFSKSAQVTGLAFGFSTYPDTPNAGTIWVDDLSLFGGPTISKAEPMAEAPSSTFEQSEENESSDRFQLPCGSAIFALPFLLIGVVLMKRNSGI